MPGTRFPRRAVKNKQEGSHPRLGCEQDGNHPSPIGGFMQPEHV